jgi:hypothetical protein
MISGPGVGGTEIIRTVSHHTLWHTEFFILYKMQLLIPFIQLTLWYTYEYMNCDIKTITTGDYQYLHFHYPHLRICDFISVLRETSVSCGNGRDFHTCPASFACNYLTLAIILAYSCHSTLHPYHTQCSVFVQCTSHFMHLFIHMQRFSGMQPPHMMTVTCKIMWRSYVHTVDSFKIRSSEMWCCVVWSTDT